MHLGRVNELPDARADAREQDTAYLDAGPNEAQGMYIVMNEEWVRVEHDGTGSRIFKQDTAHNNRLPRGNANINNEEER